MEVWLLHRYGYDAGMDYARAYSTLALGKAALPGVVWHDRGDGLWEEDVHSDLVDRWILYSCNVDAPWSE